MRPSARWPTSTPMAGSWSGTSDRTGCGPGWGSRRARSTGSSPTCWTVPASRTAGSAQAADEGHGLPEDGDVAREDGGHGRVLRLQPNVVLLAEEPLDRGLLPEQGHHDVAVVGRRLRADDEVVAFIDARLDHAVAPDPQDEGPVLPDEVAGEREDVLHVLLGEQRLARGNAPEDGHVDDTLRGMARLVLEELDRPGLARIPPDEPLLLQRGQVAVHRRAAGEAERRHDLALPLREAPAHALSPQVCRLVERGDYNIRKLHSQTHVRTFRTGIPGEVLEHAEAEWSILPGRPCSR